LPALACGLYSQTVIIGWGFSAGCEAQKVGRAFSATLETDHVNLAANLRLLLLDLGGTMPRGNIVAPIYDEIFDKDPLLLKDEKQKNYGREMLRHLLVYRLLTTSTPFPLDLHNSDDRASFRKRGKTPPPSAPDAALVARYGKIRRGREPVTEAEFDRLKDLTMVCDGRLTRSRSDLAYRNHDEAEKELKKLGQLEKFNDRLRFAAIGYRVKISKLAGIGYFGEELSALQDVGRDAVVPNLNEDQTEPAQLGRTHALDDARLERWQETILSHIEKALDRNSEIVLLPEFALPSAPSRGAPIDERIRKLSERDSVGDHFMVAGTRHEERYNRGFVVSKRKNEVKDWWHYKMASARGLGENVMGPFGKNFPSYITSMPFVNDTARITVAVCYDTYDPTMFLNIVLEAMDSQMKGKPKIILVPSFNLADDFVALLRDLSFLARCTVIYVNGLYGDARMFVCGYAIVDFANKLPLIKQTIHDERARLEKIIQEQNEADNENKKDRGWARQRNTGSSETKKLEALGVLQERLEWYEESHSIDHIITIEHCQKCESGSHDEDDPHCERDVLYYNIDVRLIQALSEFRRDFYLAEDFLPEPLQMPKLEEALTLLGQKRAA
jgi:predicted amidohydrolase